MRYHFTFMSRCLERSDFTVYDRETRETFRLCMFDNGDVSPPHHKAGATIEPDLLDAFNAWRLAQWEADKAYLASRYGQEEADSMAPFIAGRVSENA